MFNKLFTIALILVSVIASEAKTVIAAEFKLASRFQDADGDMVADTPDRSGQADGSKHIDLRLHTG